MCRIISLKPPSLAFLLQLMLCRQILLVFTVALTTAYADEAEIKVNIAPNIPHIDVNHHGTAVKILRIQDEENKLVDDFSKTSRPCPPFCIHPMEAADGVQTFGEVELLNFLQNEVASKQGLLIDARMPSWYESETIPTSINIPFSVLTQASAKRERIIELLGGIKMKTGKYDFSDAKHLCIFCNGPWCDQSPRAIRGLIESGYPAEKLAYYRGGMQLWKLLGLTTVFPKSHAVEQEQP
jgi:rhodanese-related sulfurtransferase